ncbi:MAG: PAS domain S-box protein, partial [Methanomicrobiaceae archaeon]|nr:PAS domain S-box protein [Methanomicrobiaceae archaeon]
MGASDSGDEEITSRILTYLKFKRQGMTTSELARKLKINRNSVAKYLQLLLISGQVEMQVVGNAKVYSISRRLPISTVLSFSSDLVAVLDSDARLTQINEAFLEHCGMKKEDLVGKSVEDAGIRFLDSAEIRTCIKEGLSGEKRQLEISVMEGAENIYEAKFIPTVLESGGTGLTLFLEDITMERRAEQALRRSEERFRNMADLAPFPISLVDMDGRYRYLNEKFVETFGYTLEDIPTGREWFARAFPDPDLRHEVIESWKADLKASSVGAVRPKLLPVTCKDGTEREILFRPVTLNNGNQFIIYEDLTEQRADTRNQALLAALVEFSDDAIIGRDDHGTIISWNEGAFRIYGYDAEEILGDAFDRLVPEHRREEQAAIDAMIARGESVAHFECQHLTKEKELIDVSLSLAPLIDEGNRIFGASVISRDISAKKRTETAIAESEKMYRTLFESTGTGMLIIEEDSTVSLMNVRMEQLTGFSRQGIEGKRKWYEFVSDEDRKRMLEYHRIRVQDPLSAP